jgi:prepilin-type N-terminal cleavage/methylation domain-containing protein
MRRPTHQRGVTLIEVMIAMIISAIVLAGINRLVKLGSDAAATGRATNELTYQGRFALERITDTARLVPPKSLSAAAANSTGNWFAPTGCVGTACVMYCLNAGSQLIETITSDTPCVGTTVIANGVVAFTAALPGSAGAVDRAIAIVSVTLSDGVNSVDLSSSIRLGGGTL